MKGPGYRRDLDVRRVWRCPQCGSERRVAGEVVSVLCPDCSSNTWMRIAVERTAGSQPLGMMAAPEIPVADFQLTEEELATPLEGRIRRRPPPRPQNEPGPGGADAPRGRKPGGPPRGPGASNPSTGPDADAGNPAEANRSQRPANQRSATHRQAAGEEASHEGTASGDMPPAGAPPHAKSKPRRDRPRRSQDPAHQAAAGSEPVVSERAVSDRVASEQATSTNTTPPVAPSRPADQTSAPRPESDDGFGAGLE